jgi:hypothetical protein
MQYFLDIQADFFQFFSCREKINLYLCTRFYVKVLFEGVEDGREGVDKMME